MTRAILVLVTLIYAAVDDLWYLKKRGPNGERIPSKRHGRGKRWRVRSAGLPSEAFAKRPDAERADAARRTDHARGVYIDPALGSTTIEAYSDTFRAAQLWSPGTVERAEQVFRLHINPGLGKLALSQYGSRTSL